MKSSISVTALLIALVFLFNRCDKTIIPDTTASAELNLADQTPDYKTDFPDHFNSKLYRDHQNETSDHANQIAELGRVLFYDKRLSVNNKVSCASCHLQENAFSDVVAFSEGFSGELTTRNSLPLFNNRFEEQFFWDTSAFGLENQVLVPVGNHIEMGLEDTDYLVKKLSLVQFYPDLFKKAYGNNTLSVNGIQKALTQFIRSITSTQSKYDKGYQNNFANFTSLEKEGLSIYFKAQCNSCHDLEINQDNLTNNFGSGALFNDGFNGGALTNNTGNKIANIGLDLNYKDKGVGVNNHSSSDGKFKIPSVRNIMLTAPYMHDGRFETIEEVIDHYNEGIEAHNNLDCRLTANCNSYDSALPTSNSSDPIKLDFDEYDKKALKAFLETLTDFEMINNKRYSNPFK